MSETRIHLHCGSIFDVLADAIVNPANSFLDHRGGLARVIADTATQPWKFKSPREQIRQQIAEQREHRRAHSERVNAWISDHESAPLVATGNAYHTAPGALNFRGVIHVVGPIWNGGHFMERDLLELAHDSALRICQEYGYTSIVFPAISCGVFGFPVAQAATIAVEVATWGIDYGVTDVTFALTSNEHFDAYRSILDSHDRL